MLIVCPSCATSYMIDPASLGAAGRTVRCARCKATWFATPKKQAPDVNAFVDGVIAEAQAQTMAPPEPASASGPPPPAADDFGAEPDSPVPEPQPAPPVAPPVEAPAPQAAAPEPVAIADAPSLVPPIEHAPLPEPGQAPIEADDVESYAARRERMQARRKQSRRSSRWTAIVLVLFSINVALIGARDEVVRYLPQTASLFAAIGLPVNLRHLKFENVHISKEVQDGVNILIVEGTIVSDASKPIPVPRLRFAARTATGQEIYTWTALPSRSILGPGETLDFRSRLASPPPEASDVMVRFFTAHDAEAGGK
ncbi:MAG TPA: MJ0042-type zinc finger domain-containing protein [Pseudolabrys sp.]|nr:MJ0042-type zinc finger domain-containing protein [Pseudolabrys sp.]